MWTLSWSMWDLAPWPGIEPGPSALGTQSLSPWTTRCSWNITFLYPGNLGQWQELSTAAWVPYQPKAMGHASVTAARLQAPFLPPPQGILCQETCPGNAKWCNSQPGCGQSTAGQTTASRAWQVVRVFFCSGVQGWVSVMSVNYNWTSGDISGTSINVHPEMLS